MSRQEAVVGIDLGTTNSTLALGRAAAKPEVLSVPQLDAPGVIGSHPQLPSAVYIPLPDEFEAGASVLPWHEQAPEHVIGRFALERAAAAPDRTVVSAKSWLCNEAVDRREAILPWASEIPERKISPLQASAALLSHLRHAAQSSGKCTEDLSEEEVVITVPASFDEAARNLTVEAAKDAGFQQITLLEEPLAALYAWLAAHEEQWRDSLQLGDIICVCDVGGGTADFSLVLVGEENGALSLERLSVGEHILLGGDNMDLAVAYSMQAKLEEQGHSLDSWQFQSLVHQSRVVKERLCSGEEEVLPLTLAGKGSSLFASTLQIEARREEILSLLLDGFFPRVSADELPGEEADVGISEFGLPFEAEPALTRHLAAFLSASQRQVARSTALPQSCIERAQAGALMPNVVLFNGGVFKAEPMRARVLEVLRSWNTQTEVRALENADVDLAVAQGAAHYGVLRQSGEGIRIRAGIPRSYYLGLKTAAPAVPGMRPQLKGICVARQGMEEGSEVQLPDQKFSLLTGKEVEFRFFSAQHRPEDEAGSIIENAEKELSEQSRLRVSLPAAEGAQSQSVPVMLESKITAVGTLELWMQSLEDDKRWQLEFDIRGEKKTPAAEKLSRNSAQMMNAQA